MSEPLILVDLTDAERSLMVRELLEWGGTAQLTDEMAIAMGFLGRDDYFRQLDHIVRALRTKTPLTDEDWRRAQLATEIVFASDLVGAGVEWETVSGYQTSRQSRFSERYSEKFCAHVRCEESGYHDCAPNEAKPVKPKKPENTRSEVHDLTEQIAHGHTREDMSQFRVRGVKEFAAKIEDVISHGDEVFLSSNRTAWHYSGYTVIENPGDELGGNTFPQSDAA